jgi:EAL domain-containing protein (putative c-di-GMP-specific phosphodiesterase class I)
MYGSKQAGRNTVTRYEPGMAVAVVNRHDLGIDLRSVIERDELILHYQPVVELTSLRLVGFEALVRWRHPERGLLMPDEFVPIAEDTGLIVPIGEWVLRTACTAAAQWSAPDVPGTHGPTIAVNLSARQLKDPTLPARFASILRETGIDPSLVVLELTESVLVHEPEEAASQLRSLKHLGVRLAIDDFGTGYSSLSYLRQFPVDIVKIDQSFIESVTAEHVPAITHGLLELGRSLGLTTIAEGIEDEAQLAALAAEGCDLGQGFAIGCPLPEAAAHDLARHGVFVGVPPSVRPPALHR